MRESESRGAVSAAIFNLEGKVRLLATPKCGTPTNHAETRSAPLRPRPIKNAPPTEHVETCPAPSNAR